MWLGGLLLTRPSRLCAHPQNRQGIGTQLVQQLEGMFAEEGMRTVVVRTVGMACVPVIIDLMAYAYTYYILQTKCTNRRTPPRLICRRGASWRG